MKFISSWSPRATSPQHPKMVMIAKQSVMMLLLSFLLCISSTTTTTTHVAAQCGPGGTMPYPPGTTTCPTGPGGGTGGPGGESSSGEATATGCTISSGNCAFDGTSNYYSRSLTYNSTEGRFHGTFKTNLCSNHPYGLINGVFSGRAHTASCIEQTLPAPAYNAFLQAKGAPLRGRIAMTVAGGVNVYGPMEAGFTTGQACDNSRGDCAAGVDVPTCEAELERECGTSHVTYSMLLDDCGGHALPFHYHRDLACHYNKSVIGPHSPLIAIALDGHGVYGAWELNGAEPTNLDACGGHFGPVPAYNQNGASYPSVANVYHYHVRNEAPYTLGCFGPVTTMAQCKSLYSTCGSGTLDLCTSKGSISYDDDCPCFRQPVSGGGTETYNQNFVATAACPIQKNAEPLAAGGNGTTSAAPLLQAQVMMSVCILLLSFFLTFLS